MGRGLRRGLVVLALSTVTALVVGVPLGLKLQRQLTLPVLLEAPHFTLTDARGLRFDSDKQLLGKVWVGNFIFTRCPSICPTFTAKMQRIQAASDSRVQLVSFTVDPEFDTPEVLAAYAQKHRADPLRWHFLTGTYAALTQVVVDGLKVPMDKVGGDLKSVGHGSRFVLVDGRGQVRGFYGFDDPDAVEAVVRDTQLLLKETP
jgi:protein SCO1/2